MIVNIARSRPATYVVGTSTLSCRLHRRQATTGSASGWLAMSLQAVHITGMRFSQTATRLAESACFVAMHVLGDDTCTYLPKVVVCSLCRRGQPTLNTCLSFQMGRRQGGERANAANGNSCTRVACVQVSLVAERFRVPEAKLL